MDLSEDLRLEFQERVENLRQVWAVSDRLGTPICEEDRRSALLSLELEYSGEQAGVSMSDLEHIAQWCHKWLHSRNPNYIHLAFLACRPAGICPPPSLLEMVGEVAFQSVTDGSKSAGVKRIINDAALSQALLLMCNLHISGASVKVAASKAARFIADQGYDVRYKASSLEKEYYPRRFRTGEPSLERALREARLHAAPEIDAEWKRLLADLPCADDDLEGTAR